MPDTADPQGVLEKMHAILHPYGDPDHEWSGETTDELAALVYTVIPRPMDDTGIHKDLGYNVRELRARCDEVQRALGKHSAGSELRRTVEELERDLDTFNARHFIILWMHASEEARRGWLVCMLTRVLMQNDGACLDNDAEREGVAMGLAEMLMGLAR